MKIKSSFLFLNFYFKEGLSLKSEAPSYILFFEPPLFVKIFLIYLHILLLLNLIRQLILYLYICYYTIYICLEPNYKIYIFLS